MTVEWGENVLNICGALIAVEYRKCAMVCTVYSKVTCQTFWHITCLPVPAIITGTDSQQGNIKRGLTKHTKLKEHTYQQFHLLFRRLSLLRIFHLDSGKYRCAHNIFWGPTSTKCFQSHIIKLTKELLTRGFMCNQMVTRKPFDYLLISWVTN